VLIQETQALSARFGAGFRLYARHTTLRSLMDDQRRVMTPADAVRNGSTYLVIGRPITRADDPLGILLTINSELAALN
jgi:orotidine-5'-phosphate decarboxylase